MTFLYTALNVFDKSSRKYGRGWDDYIKWSKLTHLTEVISLDSMLNETLVEPDYNSYYWLTHCCRGYSSFARKRSEGNK